mgnify:CR=1 FL=1
MDNNVGLFLSKRAMLNPDLEAVIDHASGRRFSFAALNARANRVASALHQRGIRKGDRVALLLMNGVEFVECFFALAKMGAVIVPVNWRLTADELSFILMDAGAGTLIYSHDFAGTVGELHGRGAAATEISRWIEVGPAEQRAAFAEAYDAVLASGEENEPPIAARDDDLLFIMYTSGTTGLPKGAMHTHETVLWAVFTIKATADVRFKDRYAIALPLFHVGALAPVLGNIHAGITSVLLRQFDPSAMWRVIEEESITTTLAVPAMLNFMLQVPAREESDYASLRWIMSGASPVPVALMERYRDLGIEIHQVYGLTECCGPGCLISPDQAMQRIGSTGKAFFHTDVRVVDAEGNDVGPGEPGEVIIRARHIMTGYWNNPQATAETIRDGWLHTGDVALVDEDGFLTIHDRIKDMLISGGENVYPAEIENVLLSHDKVGDVAVIGMPSKRWGESAFAVVVAKDAELSEAELLQHCEGKLARYKQPRGVAFVTEIPRNPTGKPLKRLLREQFPGPAAE